MQQKLAIPSKKPVERIIGEFNIICINEVSDNTIVCNQKTINLIKQFIDENNILKKYIVYEEE